MIVQVHLYIQGKVTGIGFRAWIRTQAQVHHAKGWVKNVGEDVEVVVQGEKEHVDYIVGLISRANPYAHISNFKRVSEKVENFTEFAIKR